jgi:hypothetical protein
MSVKDEKKIKPVSNKTSTLARELMTRTLENLAESDKDYSLQRQMKQRRYKQGK